MKVALLFLLPLSLLLSSCGPSEEELRVELQAINGELMAINIAANRFRSQMSQAEADAFFGSFAVGYGATSGDFGIARDGYNTASQANHQYDVSSYSLTQLQSRQIELLKRRTVILGKLK